MSARMKRVPYGIIEWAVSRLSVGESDGEVMAYFYERRPTKATDMEMREIVRYALEVHRRNQALYNDVVMGRIGG